MTDDQRPDPLEPIPSAEPVTDPAGSTVEPPTVEAPAATSTPPPWPSGTAGTPGTPPPSSRRTVTMPLWTFLAVGGVLLLGLGFLLGWAVAPGDDDHDRVATSAGNARELPFGDNFAPFTPDGDGNGNDGGGRGEVFGDTAFLGVVVEDSSDPDGAEIVRVAPSSPASEANLEEGDVITEVDGDAVADAAALTQQIRAADPGDTVTIEYERDGDNASVEVKLDERPAFRITPPTTTPSSSS